MYVLMRETESGKLWPMRIVEDPSELFLACWWEDELYDSGITTFYVVESKFSEDTFYPNVQKYEYSEDEESFVKVDTTNHTWHEDDEWW